MKIKNRFTGTLIGEFKIKPDSDLRGSDLRGSDLRGSDLSGSDLRGSNLRGSNLRGSDLSGSDLSGSDLSGSDLRGSNLSDSDLSGSDLRGSDLSGSNLRGSNLSASDLRGSDLRGSNLSGASGLLSPAQWMDENFEHDEIGIIVYKKFGAFRIPPTHWKIEPGAIITEVANPDRCTECGSGVNFATLKWLRSNSNPGILIWKCRIAWIDLAAVIVPYNTDGKARCERLELIEIVQPQIEEPDQ